MARRELQIGSKDCGNQRGNRRMFTSAKRTAKRSPNALAIAAISALGMTASIGHAQAVLNWDGSTTSGTSYDQGGTGTWNSTSSNWDTGSGFTTWSNADIANFAGTAGTVTLSGNQTAAGLTIGTGGYTITPSGTTNILTIGTSGIVTSNSTGTTTINGPVALSGAQTWTVATGGAFNVSGNISSGYNLTIAGGGTTTLSGTETLSGGTLNIGGNTTFSGSVVFNGSSTLNLAGTTQTLANLSLGTTTNGQTDTITNGNLTVTGAAGFTIEPVYNSTAATTVNLSGLTNFTYNQPGQSFTVSNIYNSTTPPNTMSHWSLPAGPIPSPPRRSMPATPVIPRMRAPIQRSPWIWEQRIFSAPVCFRSVAMTRTAPLYLTAG
jgi:hypothetical protein